jgi:hypothetical protein
MTFYAMLGSIGFGARSASFFCGFIIVFSVCVIKPG